MLTKTHGLSRPYCWICSRASEWNTLQQSKSPKPGTLGEREGPINGRAPSPRETRHGRVCTTTPHIYLDVLWCCDPQNPPSASNTFLLLPPRSLVAPMRNRPVLRREFMAT